MNDVQRDQLFGAWREVLHTAAPTTEHLEQLCTLAFEAHTLDAQTFEGLFIPYASAILERWPAPLRVAPSWFVTLMLESATPTPLTLFAGVDVEGEEDLSYLMSRFASRAGWIRSLSLRGELSPWMVQALTQAPLCQAIEHVTLEESMIGERSFEALSRTSRTLFSLTLREVALMPARTPPPGIRTSPHLFLVSEELASWSRALGVKHLHLTEMSEQQSASFISFPNWPLSMLDVTRSQRRSVETLVLRHSRLDNLSFCKLFCGRAYPCLRELTLRDVIVDGVRQPPEAFIFTPRLHTLRFEACDEVWEMLALLRELDGILKHLETLEIWGTTQWWSHHEEAYARQPQAVMQKITRLWYEE